MFFKAKKQKKFTIKDHYGNSYRMTDQEIYERIKADSDRSNYNWLAPVTELTRVINFADFNEEYANEIRICILRCFASLEWSITNGLGGTDTSRIQQDAIEDCYTRLAHVESEKAQNARRIYLCEQIEAAARPDDILESILHPGKTFHQFKKEWVKKYCKEYASYESIDFARMRKKLRKDWLAKYRKADADHVFDEADKNTFDDIAKMIQKSTFCTQEFGLGHGPSIEYFCQKKLNDD